VTPRPRASDNPLTRIITSRTLSEGTYAVGVVEKASQFLPDYFLKK